MIFKVSTLGYIVDWDKASSKEKDAMMRALERVRTAYIFETRRIQRMLKIVVLKYKN